MVEIGFLGRVMFFPKGKNPVLDDAGGEFVEGTHLVGGHFHPVGDRFENLVVVNLPIQTRTDQSADRARPRARFSTERHVAKTRDGYALRVRFLWPRAGPE